MAAIIAPFTVVLVKSQYNSVQTFRTQDEFYEQMIRSFLLDRFFPMEDGNDVAKIEKNVLNFIRPILHELNDDLDSALDGPEWERGEDVTPEIEDEG